MGSLVEARQDLTDRLRAVGVKVAADPAGVVPPCVLVDVGRVDPDQRLARRLELPVLVILAGPVTGAGVDAGLELAELVMSVDPSATLEPGIRSSLFGDVELPGFTVTITRRVAGVCAPAVAVPAERLQTK